MKKKLLAVLLAGCMGAALLAGCGDKKEPEKKEEPKQEETKKDEEIKTDDGETKDLHFEVVVKSFQSSYWQAAVKGIEQAEEELGVTANTTGPNQESDIADQVTMLNSAINLKPAGIALAACDAKSVITSLKDALAKNIPVVCFDGPVPDAPEGSVYATVVTNNYRAGSIAAEHIYAAVKDKIAAAKAPVRVGEVNQDSTGANIIDRGMGFVNKFIELAKADGKKCAVVGNELYVGKAEGAVAEGEADIIIDVAVPTATSVDLCSTEAARILKEENTIAIFGSNQVSAEGVLTANQNLNILGSDSSKNIIAAGFDAGATIKQAVRDGVMIGAVTQSPLMQGKLAIETLVKINKGEKVQDIETDGYWYDKDNMEDPQISPNLYD